MEPMGTNADLKLRIFRMLVLIVWVRKMRISRVLTLRISRVLKLLIFRVPKLQTHRVLNLRICWVLELQISVFKMQNDI